MMNMTNCITCPNDHNNNFVRLAVQQGMTCDVCYSMWIEEEMLNIADKKIAFINKMIAKNQGKTVAVEDQAALAQPFNVVRHTGMISQVEKDIKKFEQRRLDALIEALYANN